MNIYEFFLALNLWQWVGVILLTGIVFGGIASIGPFVVTSNKHRSTWNTTYNGDKKSKVEEAES